MKPSPSSSTTELKDLIEATVSACEASGWIEVTPFVLQRVRYHLSRAESDCATLDAEGGTFFSERFAASLRDPKAPYIVAKYALLSEDRDAWNPVAKAREAGGEELETKWFLFLFRDLLSDQHPLPEALRSLSETIARKAKIGDASFFRQLGKVISEVETKPDRFKRSYAKWLVRGWISLALWQCAGYAEAWDLLTRAGLTLGIDWKHSTDAAANNSFRTAWTRVAKGNRTPIE